MFTFTYMKLVCMVLPEVLSSGTLLFLLRLTPKNITSSAELKRSMKQTTNAAIHSRSSPWNKHKINEAISMMRGKSPPSELILEEIKSNNSLIFFFLNMKREIISLLSKYYFVQFLHIYSNKKGKKSAKYQKKSIFISLTFKFAIFTY